MCVPVPLQVLPEAQLSYVESESIFRVSRLLEPLLQEGFDSFLVRPGESGGRYVCELLVSLPVRSA